jgi:16S rRNA (guanine527-N7)-methyltransferase
LATATTNTASNNTIGTQTTNNLSAILAEGIAALQLNVDAAAQLKLIHYLSLLSRWNRIHNLTAIDEPSDMVRLHLLDSLTVLGHITNAMQKDSCKTLLDIGSGAGLPGIVLAVCLPDLKITSVDSVAKKISFQAQVKAELKLDNFTPTQARIEQMRTKEPFDAAICRAFSSLTDFVAHATRLVKADGKLFAMKGEVPISEIETLETKAYTSTIAKLAVPGLDAERHLIITKNHTNSDHA